MGERGQTGLNGGCCQELIALGRSAGLCVCVQQSPSVFRMEGGNETGREGEQRKEHVVCMYALSCLRVIECVCI